jgi:2-C-methyl-D-erythritol 4-phosphate cytidylyltransferase
MRDTLVIIPAAGSGARFGGDLPKQFRQLGGRPVVLHAIERFLASPRVAHIVLAVAEERIGLTRDSGFLPPEVELVTGGATRQYSVMRALQSHRADELPLVAVHDSVRPFFRTSTFHALLDAAGEYGAALPAVPVTDTIHQVNDGLVVATLDRTHLGAAQTPQCFRTPVLRDILARATAEQLNGTDEAGLAARFGHRVRVLEGDASNLKITRAGDLAFAELLLTRWSDE